MNANEVGRFCRCKQPNGFLRCRRECAKLMGLQLTRQLAGVRHDLTAKRRRYVDLFRQIDSGQELRSRDPRLFPTSMQKCADHNKSDSDCNGKLFRVNRKLTSSENLMGLELYMCNSAQGRFEANQLELSSLSTAATIFASCTCATQQTARSRSANGRERT